MYLFFYLQDSLRSKHLNTPKRLKASLNYVDSELERARPATRDAFALSSCYVHGWWENFDLVTKLGLDFDFI